MQFNKPTLKALLPQMQTVLDQLGSELGIQITVGNASYTAEEATFKVSLRDENAPEPHVANWNKMARLYGLDPDWLGKSFRHSDDKVYEIVGLDPNARKYPLLAKSVRTGTVYKFVPHEVKARLEA